MFPPNLSSKGFATAVIALPIAFTICVLGFDNKALIHTSFAISQNLF